MFCKTSFSEKAPSTTTTASLFLISASKTLEGQSTSSPPLPLLLHVHLPLRLHFYCASEFSLVLALKFPCASADSLAFASLCVCAFAFTFASAFEIFAVGYGKRRWRGSRSGCQTVPDLSRSMHRSSVKKRPRSRRRRPFACAAWNLAARSERTAIFSSPWRMNSRRGKAT